jgi:hypothetical protein
LSWLKISTSSVKSAKFDRPITGISFIANKFSVSLLRPNKTLPKLPWPMISEDSQLLGTLISLIGASSNNN